MKTIPGSGIWTCESHLLIDGLLQRNDGKPIHLKKGATDAIMYYTTMTASVVGVVGAGHLFYSIIWPAKEE